MAHPALKDVFAQLKTRMDKAVEDFRREMAATRTGRANVHMLDTVSVDYYGSQMPLNQIAQIHAPEPQMITVQPFDPSQLGAIEKAIRSADLGLNPMNDGKLDEPGGHRPRRPHRHINNIRPHRGGRVIRRVV